MVTLYIDNKPYEVQPGKNLLETCIGLGFDIPYFCWHPALGSVGACRQCAVKVYRGEDDTKGRLVMSCMEPVTDNQRISINDGQAKEFRAHIIEWLMTNHPHDCAVCDEGGSCHLQDMTVMTGHNYRRFQYKKRTYRNQYLGPFLNHEMNRCIQCYRCVRFYRDYAGGDDLDVFASRNNVYFGRAADGILENEFSGNLAEVCPTGVFTDKTLKQHYTRKWDLTSAPSICHHCSLGCNTIAGERYGSLRSITTRYHDKVNGYFLCDRGRYGYEFTNAKDRIIEPRIDAEIVNGERVVHAVGDILKSQRVIGIGSPRASLQSNFALKELVGADNFYHGVSVDEHDLAELIIRILSEGPVRTPSMREVETADAVFILGEDLTNTAPMLALAVRQAVRQQPLEDAQSAGIPPWHDAAARERAQNQRGPLFIASVMETRLHDVATQTYHAAPDDLARLGYAVAHQLDPTLPPVSNLPGEVLDQAKHIADTLRVAKRPVIISGMSCDCATVIKSAANVAWALHKTNPKTGLVFTAPECNSIGLALMGGHRLNTAFNAVINGHADAVIILENDLYRHAKKDMVDRFLDTCRHVIAIDHTPTATTHRADILIPAGTYAESDGILVNNEGRAQRAFQVFESSPVIQESWRWLLRFAVDTEHEIMSQWRNFNDVTNALAENEPRLAGINTVTPPPDFRIAGQKIPRAPHRFSGRTAMQAHIHVSEPKPPEDSDSPLSYTMEGYRGTPPSSMISFYWAPGWNSVQAVNKYQKEVNGDLLGGSPGIRLIEPASNSSAPYFADIPEVFVPMPDHLWLVNLYHIFGSEELSARGAAILTRVPQPYIMLNPADAEQYSVSDGDTLEFEVMRQHYALPVRVNTTLPLGVAGMPYGLPELPFVDLPAWAAVKVLAHA